MNRKQILNIANEQTIPMRWKSLVEVWTWLIAGQEMC